MTDRRRWRNTEQTVARWFTAHGWPDTRTTRAALGHSGTRQPGDILLDGRIVVEIKDRARAAWPAWIDQTAAQAAGCPWLLIRRLHGVSDPGRWPTVEPFHLDDPAIDVLHLQVGSAVARMLDRGVPVDVAYGDWLYHIDTLHRWNERHRP